MIQERNFSSLKLADSYKIFTRLSDVFVYLKILNKFYPLYF